MATENPRAATWVMKVAQDKALYAAVTACLLGALATGVFVSPAYEKMLGDFGVAFPGETEIVLSPWWSVGWGLGLTMALVASFFAVSRMKTKLILASALVLYVSGWVFFFWALPTVGLHAGPIK